MKPRSPAFILKDGRLCRLRLCPDGPHRFGGVPVHRGVTPANTGAPLQTILLLDLADGNCPIESNGTARYLPLYHPLRYGSTAVQYAVLSDDEIKILYQYPSMGWTISGTDIKAPAWSLFWSMPFLQDDYRIQSGEPTVAPRTRRPTGRSCGVGSLQSPDSYAFVIRTVTAGQFISGEKGAQTIEHGRAVVVPVLCQNERHGPAEVAQEFRPHQIPLQEVGLVVVMVAVQQDSQSVRGFSLAAHGQIAAEMRLPHRAIDDVTQFDQGGGDLLGQRVVRFFRRVVGRRLPARHPAEHPLRRLTIADGDGLGVAKVVLQAVRRRRCSRS